MEHKQVPRIILSGDHEAASYMSREGMRQLDILKNLMGFQQLKQDVRRVRYIDGSEIVCKSTFGIDNIQIYVPKKVAEIEIATKLYVYVTISDYVTIWDLETGEVAKNVYDNTSDSLITFPCHKDELARWLEGIVDRPTRQVLKDDPEDNRDYLDDNQLDIGNENRVICTPDTVLWYEVDCIGLDSCLNFINEVRHEQEDTCSEGCTCYWYDLLEKDTVVDYPEYTESWQSSYEGFERVCPDYYYECFTPGGSRCFLEVYKPRSQHLILCPYPQDYHGWQDAEHEVVDMICKQASYTYHYVYIANIDGLPEYIPFISADVYSYKTPLGELVLDFIPRKKLEEGFSDLDDYKTLQETMRYVDLKVSEYTDVVNNHINVNDLDEDLAKYITDAYPTSASEYWYAYPPSTKDCTITAKNFGELGESNRYGVSWCEHPSITDDWYKVKLFFYTGKVSCAERSNHYESGEWSELLGCSGGETITTSCDRFSSVHATIELVHPENYIKENTSVPGKPIWVEKYRRPDDYSGLCAFTDRECGYPEGSGNICYPFDGTYDIYTLGEAVEKLINDHYEDESDDQLVVYLLKKSGLAPRQEYDSKATVVEM